MGGRAVISRLRLALKPRSGAPRCWQCGGDDDGDLAGGKARLWARTGAHLWGWKRRDRRRAARMHARAPLPPGPRTGAGPPCAPWHVSAAAARLVPQHRSCFVPRPLGAPVDASIGPLIFVRPAFRVQNFSHNLSGRLLVPHSPPA